eukprot:scaffold24550_cov60-Cyclotella_meneghiniana.AAC.8
MEARLRQQRTPRPSTLSTANTKSDARERETYASSRPTSASTNAADTATSNVSQVQKEIDAVVDRSTNWASHASETAPAVALPPRPRRVVDAATKLANTPAVATASYTNAPTANSVASITAAQHQNATPASTPSTSVNHLTNTPARTSSETPSRPAAYLTPNAAYNALPNRQDLDNNDYNSSSDHGDNNSADEPKTPSTLMRSIKRSMSKDRNDMEKRALFDANENRQYNNGNSIHNDEYEGEENTEMEEVDDDDEDDVPNDAFHRREFNSSSLLYGSEIIIRFPTRTALTSLAVQPADTNDTTQEVVPMDAAKTTERRVCLVANETHGCFGTEENRFVILSDKKRGDDYDDNEDESTYPYVCYGDVITLRSTMLERVLGIQKVEVLDEESGGTLVTAKVGCFRRHGKFPPADRWVILRGGPDAGLVELGPDLPHDNHGNIPVYSGDSIVLRNDFTGGVLSLGDVVEDLPHVTPVNDIVGWSLNLITSSYQMHDGVASTEDDVELIDFLHRHNQCKPGKKETFQILTADVPSCPDWVYPIDERKDRCFLDGSYLSNPNRHDYDAFLEDEMWRDTSSLPELKGSGTTQRLASLPVNAQEAILLDEVIGAMMGLEGQFIRYYSGHTESNDDDGTQPGFVFAPLAYTGGKVDTTLEEIVSRILPLCSNYVSVNNYVQSCLCHYECGIMARALCEAMGKLLQEHLDFVLSLNQQLQEGTKNDGKPLSMTMVHALTRPADRTMSTLYQVVYAVQGKKGGDLLNSLQKLCKYNYSGDSKFNEVLNHLLSVCAVHYARMLKSWMNAGKLHDPYREFMIEVTNRKFQSNSVVVKEGIEFENWCRVNDIHVFTNFDNSRELDMTNMTTFGVDRHRSTSHMSTLDKVHTTGKYRRAIHFCHEGIPVVTPETESSSEEDARVLLNPLKLSRSIDALYHSASDELLKLMLEKYDLLSSLQLMKKYFLLDQGDFFVEFLDIADDQLARNVSTVSRGQVQDAVETSIGRTSDFILQSSSSDLNHMSSLPQATQLASALSCGFKQQSLVEELDDLHRQTHGKLSKGKTRQKELNGYEALQLELKRIPFPTSLVLAHSPMRIYQFLFRQIFFAKYVERQLVNLWSDHQLMKQMSALKEMKKTFCLRRRMIHFIQNFVYYIKFDVVEPNWRELESKLIAAKQHCTKSQASSQLGGSFPRTVDDLLAEHNQFLINVINQCLLTNSDLIRASLKIMTACLLFTDQMRLFMATTKIADHHEVTRSEGTKMRHSGLAKQKIDNARKSQFREQRQERTRRCSDRITREARTETFEHMVQKFDMVFSAHLSDFMMALKYDCGNRSSGHYTNLFMQLDYNEFVSSSLRKGK